MIKKIFNSVLKDYYLIILFFIVEILNLLKTYNIVIQGLIFDLFLIALTILSIIVIIKYNDSLKYKRLILPLYVIFFIIGDKLFLNNLLYTALMVIPIVFIIALNFHKDNFIEMSGIIAITVTVILFPLLFFLHDLSPTDRNNIYEDTHYQCGEYEIFSYSAGAMDSYHYAVVKKHKYIDFGNILEIWYDEYIGDTELEYEMILNSNVCYLID